jgi:CHAT domain-containing protein
LLVPAGELCRVPFAALVDQHGQYEIQHYTFTYLTTGRDLVRPKAVRTDRSSPLILAGPDFEQIDASEEGVLTQLRWFSPLEQAKEEGRALQKLIPGSVLKTGLSASKLAIAEVRAPSILHFATHGFFQPDVRDNMDRLLQTFSGAALPSPLLRSGIALAGANCHRDGLLTSLEISGLDLRGTEVVALSACETGLGDVSSWEGVYGFRRAFFLAGVESLLVSLFPAPDKETRRLMEAYYERLLAGKGRSQALREAQLSMLSIGEAGHPMNWAAFIMIGDWSPISLRHS